MNIGIIIYGLLILFFSNCRRSDANKPVPPVTTTTDTTVTITTDKACYAPGDLIRFTVNQSLPSSAKIRYRWLDSIVDQTAFGGMNWTWSAPPRDFMGYMVDIYRDGKEGEKIYGSIAVDVSSDWSKFPRYGFLSAYGPLSETYMDSIVNDLCRYHINGLQFYDWEYKHQLPLAGTVADPASTWRDIANRQNYLATVQKYITLAHSRNMKAMSYNLAYGALSDAASDGVDDRWYMYTDPNHTVKDVLNLPVPPFKSNIYLLDPSNTGWQNYIASKTAEAYAVYKFDGFHVDQVGDRNKNLYTYSGAPINLPATFQSFLTAMKTAEPSKRLVMNAVNQYGQQSSIASAPVDFLYTEVWPPNEGYKDLAATIMDNDAWSNYSKKTVLAAYMDYDLANAAGYFNTSGVLLTDAVIFAFGGAHLELGDHMLCKEYFPNDNLKMRPDLQQALIGYYDFLVGYENILRGGGSFNNPTLTSADGRVILNNWPPVSGMVSVIGKDLGNAQVIHLLNFSNAKSLNWRDAGGVQPQPLKYSQVALGFSSSRPVKKIWMASPDINGGVAITVPFQQSGNAVSFVLPSLQYWDMIVIMY